MFIEYDTFRQRADALMLRITECCRVAGRSPNEVTLLPVTKTHPVAAAEYAIRYGLTAVGENRVQEALQKIIGVAPALRWELIGHLQSNKAKLAATHVPGFRALIVKSSLPPSTAPPGSSVKSYPCYYKLMPGMIRLNLASSQLTRPACSNARWRRPTCKSTDS